MNVVISGGSRGLGRSIAEVFASAGNDLWLCSKNELSLRKTIAELKKIFPGVQIEGQAADLSLEKETGDFGEWVLKNAGSVDVLVNNAGLFLPGNVHEEPSGILEKMIAVNLYSAYHLTRTLIQPMMKARRGHIFNMCSIASLQAYRNGGSYSISKFALAGFTKNLREEMKPYGIKVTAVFPGAVYTDAWANSGVDPSRIMQATDIAQLVFAAAALSSAACVEDIVVRPQLGDL